MDNKDTEKDETDLTDKTLLSEFPCTVAWSDSTGEYLKKASKDKNNSPVEYAGFKKVLKLC